MSLVPCRPPTTFVGAQLGFSTVDSPRLAFHLFILSDPAVSPVSLAPALASPLPPHCSLSLLVPAAPLPSLCVLAASDFSAGSSLPACVSSWRPQRPPPHLGCPLCPSQPFCLWQREVGSWPSRSPGWRTVPSPCPVQGHGVHPQHHPVSPSVAGPRSPTVPSVSQWPGARWFSPCAIIWDLHLPAGCRALGRVGGATGLLLKGSEARAVGGGLLGFLSAARPRSQVVGLCAVQLVPGAWRVGASAEVLLWGARACRSSSGVMGLA